MKIITEVCWESYTSVDVIEYVKKITTSVRTSFSMVRAPNGSYLAYEHELTLDEIKRGFTLVGKFLAFDGLHARIICGLLNNKKMKLDQVFDTPLTKEEVKTYSYQSDRSRAFDAAKSGGTEKNP